MLPLVRPRLPRVPLEADLAHAQMYTSGTYTRYWLKLPSGIELGTERHQEEPSGSSIDSPASTLLPPATHRTPRPWIATEGCTWPRQEAQGDLKVKVRGLRRDVPGPAGTPQDLPSVN